MSEIPSFNTKLSGEIRGLGQTLKEVEQEKGEELTKLGYFVKVLSSKKRRHLVPITWDEFIFIGGDDSLDPFSLMKKIGMKYNGFNFSGGVDCINYMRALTIISRWNGWGNI